MACWPSQQVAARAAGQHVQERHGEGQQRRDVRCALEGLGEGSVCGAALGWTQGGVEVRDTWAAWSSAPASMASARSGVEQSNGEGQGGRARALARESEGIEAWRSSASSLEEQGRMVVMVGAWPMHGGRMDITSNT